MICRESKPQVQPDYGFFRAKNDVQSASSSTTPRILDHIGELSPMMRVRIWSNGFARLKYRHRLATTATALRIDTP
jgi:hypothetical protein